MYLNVDAALTLPVNMLPLVDNTTFATIQTGVAYNAAGMALKWNFLTTAGVFSQVAVTPTSGGDYDWTHEGGGMYSIGAPASGGASMNNDATGYGWFTGVADGVAVFRSPVFTFRPQLTNDALIHGTEFLPVDAHKPVFSISGLTQTVKKPDGSTTAYTKTLTTDPAAEPITGAS